MSLDSDFIAKVTTQVVSGKNKIGTAYPIRDGVIITAYHVIPDIDNIQKTKIVWKSQGKKKNSITRILYQSKKYDVVIAECQTPPNLPKVILSKNRPSSKESWDAFGYAFSAIDIEKKTHNKETASGSYHKAPKGSPVQQLHAKDYATDSKFWKGMSGSPIFTAETDHLTGIFIESSLEYENEEGKDKPIFRGRLRAASIAFLLEDKEKGEEFANAIYGESLQNYRKTFKKRLEKHFDKIKDEHSGLFEILPSLAELLNKLQEDSIDCIKDLKNKCSSYSGEAQDDIETLFYLLLSQIDVPCKWEGKHQHELNVSTRLMAELSVARLYNVPPNFKSETEDNELIGKHVIPLSQIECGCDIEKSAKEQANNIACAVYKRFGNEDLTKKELLINHDEYKEVNDTLQLFREDNEAVYRFEINEKSNEAKDHSLINPDVRGYIHQHLLPDLPIVLYGGSSTTRIDNEKSLQAHVRAFIRKIIRSE